jgi:hypothetical protein
MGAIIVLRRTAKLFAALVHHYYAGWRHLLMALEMQKSGPSGPLWFID